MRDGGEMLHELAHRADDPGRHGSERMRYPQGAPIRAVRSADSANLSTTPQGAAGREQLMLGRRVGRVVAVLVTALAAVVAVGGSAGAIGAAGGGPVLAPVVAPTAAVATTLDGIAFGHLPGGLGRSSNFTYSYDDVDFRSRVWESRRPAGGWRVDLNIDVMRGARLSDAKALHDWFIAYEERPPGEARYIYVIVHGHPGWLSRGQVFWLERPGLAVSVSLDRSRWPVPEVVRTGWSAREVT